jgi:hypothetical protein
MFIKAYFRYLKMWQFLPLAFQKKHWHIIRFMLWVTIFTSTQRPPLHRTTIHKYWFEFISTQEKQNKVFLNFGVTCPFLAVFIIFIFRGSNPRTMAQTARPRCSPLDQGASRKKSLLFTSKKLRLRKTDADICESKKSDLFRYTSKVKM